MWLLNVHFSYVWNIFFLLLLLETTTKFDIIFFYSPLPTLILSKTYLLSNLKNTEADSENFRLPLLPSHLSCFQNGIQLFFWEIWILRGKKKNTCRCFNIRLVSLTNYKYRANLTFTKTAPQVWPCGRIVKINTQKVSKILLNFASFKKEAFFISPIMK